MLLLFIEQLPRILSLTEAINKNLRWQDAVVHEIFDVAHRGIFPVLLWSAATVRAFEENLPPDQNLEITLINTSQCHLVGRKSPPPITRTHENVVRLQCNKAQVLFTDTRSDGSYLMPSQIFEVLWCKYWLYTPQDWNMEKLLGDGQFNLIPNEQKGFKVGRGRQTVRVLCTSALNETKYHDVLLFLPP